MRFCLSTIPLKKHLRTSDSQSPLHYSDSVSTTHQISASDPRDFSHSWGL